MKTGVAFGDHIKTEKVFRRKSYEGRNNNSPRGIFLLLVLFLAIGILSFKLVNLQVVKGAYYRSLSDSNRIRTKVMFAPRGVLFDRNNIPLVLNDPGYRVIDGEETSIVSRERALEAIASGKTNIAIDSLRNYTYKEAFSHVLGYVGQITEDEMKNDAYSDYAITDWVGKTGLELQYESLLRGINGKQLVEVDAAGKETRILGQTEPVPGQDITLTLDAQLQQASYKAMAEIDRGAVVITNTKGEILTLLSKPSYDPNLFTLDDTYKATTSGYTNVEQIVMDGVKMPLLDRAISGTYPPGSTFKMITSAAGLESKIIDESYTVEDTGIVRIGEFSFSNWFYTQQGGKDGEVNVVKGLARSNDIFFYRLAEKIGVDTLSAMAGKMGVGSVLGIDLSGEAKGVLPTKKWKMQNVGESWYTGDNYHYGIGQGYLLTTPLQVNAWTQGFANNGKIYRPHLVKEARPEVVMDAKLSDKTTELIRQGMIDVCRTGGTAWPLFNFAVANDELKIDGKNILEAPLATGSAQTNKKQIAIACKTGTAEHGRETPPHAWITLFAPAYDPEIVVTILVEEKGEGSNEAGPIAKKILEAYFSQK